MPESALRDDEAFDLIREERGLLERSSVSLLRPTDTGTATGTARVRGRRRSSVAQTVQDVDLTWEDAVKMGRVTTSWKYELGVMARYSVWITPPSPLALFWDGSLTAGAVGGYFLYVFGMGSGVTVVLQQSLALASVLSLGHLGTTELGGNIYTIFCII